MLLLRNLSSSTRICSSQGTKYITNPIFYVNSKPHLGHLYTVVLSDTLRRWYKLKGHTVEYSIGTDEHGLKIQEAARKAGIAPRSFCDIVSGEFKKLFDRAEIDTTGFIRTSEERHYAAVSHFWTQLMNGGWIYKGWYSISDETFVPENQTEAAVIDGIQVTDSRKVVEWTKEENYKFKLSAFQGQLIEWLEADESGTGLSDIVIVPKYQYKDILSQLKSQPLVDLSISRLKSRVEWGISVPNDSEHVIYVWLDALTNYLTVTGYPWKGGEMPISWPPSWQIVGKDIIKFHAIYWPAFLLAVDLPLPKRILSHGHWLISNQKMSKSSGNGVDPYELMDKYGIDAIRYFLLRDGGIAIDPEFSLETVWRRYKHDLAGQLGNLMMRSTSIKINPSGLIPHSMPIPPNAEEIDILEQCATLRQKVDIHMEAALISEALVEIARLVSTINRYWSLVEPWKFKEEDKSRLENILYVTFEGVRIVGILLSPVMPSSSKKILDCLNLNRMERTYEYAVLKPSLEDRRVTPAGVLFPQIKQ